MHSSQTPVEICNEIAGELRDVASWLASGKLSPQQFSTAVLTLENAKVARFGFTLTAINFPDGRVHFSLRFKGTQKVCATMAYDPVTSQLSAHHICEE